jgi:hypothetical protein
MRRKPKGDNYDPEQLTNRAEPTVRRDGSSVAAPASKIAAAGKRLGRRKT